MISPIALLLVYILPRMVFERSVGFRFTCRKSDEYLEEIADGLWPEPQNSNLWTVRVHEPVMGASTTLEGRQWAFTGTDRPRAPECGGEACRWQPDPRGRRGTQHRRGCLPPLEKPLRRNELQQGKAPKSIA